MRCRAASGQSSLWYSRSNIDFDFIGQHSVLQTIHQEGNEPGVLHPCVAKPGITAGLTTRLR